MNSKSYLAILCMTISGSSFAQYSQLASKYGVESMDLNGNGRIDRKEVAKIHDRKISQLRDDFREAIIPVKKHIQNKRFSCEIFSAAKDSTFIETVERIKFTRQDYYNTAFKLEHTDPKYNGILASYPTEKEKDKEKDMYVTKIADEGELIARYFKNEGGKTKIYYFSVREMELEDSTEEEPKFKLILELSTQDYNRKELKLRPKADVPKKTRVESYGVCEKLI
jgi:hypothetical protein